MAVVTITPRLIHIQDLALTTTAAGETESVTVLGAGAQTLNKIDMVRLTQFTSAANDSAAAGAGVAVGEIYYDSTASKLHARMA